MIMMEIQRTYVYVRIRRECGTYCIIRMFKSHIEPGITYIMRNYYDILRISFCPFLQPVRIHPYTIVPDVRVYISAMAD